MDTEIITIMLPAFAECLVLVGIHSYLGIHVIKRKVIFVDLALAQIAALGTTFAFLFGIDPSSTGAYWFSLGFTIIGAAVFSLSRIRYEKVPQEAIIGLVYALTAAAAIIVVDRGPHGAEHIKEIMTGSILWVKWKTIWIAAVVYAVVGLFHFVFRKKILLISNHPEIAYQKGINVRLWDFLFYVSFGVVITHSVSTAGVLLVFVFLVVPAVATIMITDKLWLQLILGWTMGTLVSMLGLYISYIGDLPSGPTVVTTYGLVLLITALGLYVIKAKQKYIAIRNIAFGIGIVLLALTIFWAMGKGFSKSGHHESEVIIAQEEHDRLHEKYQKELLEVSDQQLKDMIEGELSIQVLLELYEKVENPFQKFEIAHRIFDLDRKNGSKVLIDYLEFCKIPFLKQKALELLTLISKDTFGYDALKSLQENKQSITEWRNWWNRKFMEE